MYGFHNQLLLLITSIVNTTTELYQSKRHSSKMIDTIHHTPYTCLTVFGWKKFFAYHIPWGMDSAICNVLAFFVGFPLLKFTVFVLSISLCKENFIICQPPQCSPKNTIAFLIYSLRMALIIPVFTRTEELTFAIDDK